MPTNRSTVLVVIAAVAFALLAPAAGADDLTDQLADSAVSSVTAISGWERAPDELAERLTDVRDGKALAAEVGETDDRGLPVARFSSECVDGRAGPFPCENVDLLAYVPNAELGAANGNDLWGWTDPETGDEYAIMGTGYNTAFVRVTDPTDPQVVALTPSSSAGYIPLWRDIKVYEDHAFIVSEHTGHGLQVVDLTELRDLQGNPPAVIQPETVFNEFSWAHNIAINEDTGFAYVVGSDRCDGGLFMVDISTPTEPSFAGCFGEDEEAGTTDGDGYTHDVQCVVYHGPSGKYRGDEICFASNEDTVTIVDVTDKQNPVMLARVEYEEAAYTHQGWLTPDHRWFVFGDELDEQRGTVDNTTTFILDVSNLEKPGEVLAYAHETNTIDHNLYIDGPFVYQANYTEGLRILTYDKWSLRQGELTEVAYFDVLPGVDIEEFAGAWSVYPFFESGTLVVSTIEQGLFLLEADLPELHQRQTKPPVV